MNLICVLSFLVLKFGFVSCLRINELKIDQFLSTNNFNLPEDKDYLDVDVTSDILPSMTTIYDVQREPVCISNELGTNINNF